MNNKNNKNRKLCFLEQMDACIVAVTVQENV